MEKKNNSLVITLLIIIIIILGGLCVLLATDTIKFDFNGKKDNEVNEKDNNIKENILSDKEAEKIVSGIFNDDIVRKVFDNPSPYCDEVDTSKSYTESDLGLYDLASGWDYYKCESGSFDEIVAKVKEKFTDEYYINNVEGKSIVTEYVEFNGKKSYFYYSVDGDLYITSGGKGGNIDKDELYDISYEKVGITEKNISYKVKAVWHDYNNNDYIENINITLVKDGNNWKIDKYDVTSQSYN